jgi:hypothetical protein
MDLVSSETSLVVAGAWNAAILTPAWVRQYGLGLPPGEQALVQVFLPAVRGALFELPRYVFDEFSFVVRPDALVVIPRDGTAQSLELAEDSVAKILIALAHTPVTGIGHNFEFRSLSPTPPQLAVFTQARQDLIDCMSADWSAVGVSIVSSFKNPADTVQINVHRQWDGGAISVKFNFHHAVATAEQAAAVLAGSNDYARMARNMEVAKELVESVYGDPT